MQEYFTIVIFSLFGLFSICPFVVIYCVRHPFAGKEKKKIKPKEKCKKKKKLTRNRTLYIECEAEERADVTVISLFCSPMDVCPLLVKGTLTFCISLFVIHDAVYV